MSDIFFWLFWTFFWTSCMSFFSAEEMACISYNKLKLEVQARTGSRRAQWIRALIKKPTAFFGTTLIGVNFCLVISSECMRQLFQSCSLNPNMSPLVHVPYVLIFGELVPMFTARLFPEHTAKFGSPLLRITSILITPLAFLSDAFFKILFRPFMKIDKETDASRFHHEELQELLRSPTDQKKEEDNPSSRLFQTLQKMQETETGFYMDPIDSFPILSEKKDAACALEKMRRAKKKVVIVCTLHKKSIGCVTEEQLLLASASTPLQAIIREILFISEKTKASETLFRMRQEKAFYAFVLNKKGTIVGLISLYTLLKECIPQFDIPTKTPPLHISKTISATTKIADFCAKYDIDIEHHQDETFLDMMEQHFDHKPKVGEILVIGPLEVTVKETSLLGPKTLFVRS